MGKNRAGDTILPDLKLYCKAIIITTAWYWDKNRHLDPQHRTESPETNLHFDGQLIFDKGVKNT